MGVVKHSVSAFVSTQAGLVKLVLTKLVLTKLFGLMTRLADDTKKMISWLRQLVIELADDDFL